MDRAEFYDVRRVAILPMGMCYPGRLPNGGDAPPRPECAPLWRPRVMAAMPALRLILLVGSYAQVAALGPGRMTGPGASLPGLSAAPVSAAPPIMAHGRVGAGESVVRRRGFACLARGHRRSARGLGAYQKKWRSIAGPPSLGRKRPRRRRGLSGAVDYERRLVWVAWQAKMLRCNKRFIHLLRHRRTSCRKGPSRPRCVRYHGR